MSEIEREKLNERVTKVQASGIIRESTSPYASQAFFVLKEGKKDRMIMDYRSLNNITKPIKYPLTLIYWWSDR